MKRLGGGLGSQARISRGRTPKRETAKSGRMQGAARNGAEAVHRRDRQTVCRGWGSAADLAGERLGVRAAQNRTPSSPKSSVLPPPPFLPGPHSTRLCPDSFVRTDPPPTNCTPTPALGTQGILAMCSVPSAGGKKRSKKGKTLSLGLCLCMATHSRPSLPLP